MIIEGAERNSEAEINSVMAKRILIVDDEPYNILAMQLVIGHLGIRGLNSIIDRAYNGLEALAKVKDAFEKNSHVYGLILTDISMPVVDGYEVAEEVREFYRMKRVPQPMIVACTGHVEEQFIQKAWTHEIDEVVPKPVKVDVLRSIFDVIL